MQKKRFIAGAEWGAEHLRKPTKMMDEDKKKAARLYAIPHYTKDVDIEHLDEYPYDSGLEAAFIAGAEWQRNSEWKPSDEQMMELQHVIDCIEDEWGDDEPVLRSLYEDLETEGGREMTDCIRLRRGNLCRLDLKPCTKNCPLRKTKEEIERNKTRI